MPLRTYSLYHDPAGTAFVFISTYATMFAWRNFDGLFGLTVSIVALGSVISYLARPGRRGLLISAVSVALIPGSDTMNFAVLFVTRVLFGTYLVLGRPLEFYDFQSIQHQLGFSYVVIFRFRLPYDQFVPYVGTLVYENSAVEIFRVNAT